MEIEVNGTTKQVEWAVAIKTRVDTAIDTMIEKMENPDACFSHDEFDWDEYVEINPKNDTKRQKCIAQLKRTKNALDKMESARFWIDIIRGGEIFPRSNNDDEDIRDLVQLLTYSLGIWNQSTGNFRNTFVMDVDGDYTIYERIMSYFA